jgi:REP element-mobilizing transposase RayT
MPTQLGLQITPRQGWGGARAGAGRPRGRNPRVWHRSRERFPRHAACHVTLRVRRDVPSLRSARFVRAAERTLVASCERGEARLVHYSIQPDHVHLMVEATGREALGRAMKSLAARLARAANRTFRRRGPVLADRYHVRILRTPLEVRRALAYVLLNARRHAAKRGRRPGDASIDPASSGRWFDGWRGSARGWPPRSPDPPAVARPRTWLVRVGWRRRGLIDPAEVPGSRNGRRPGR